MLSETARSAAGGPEMRAEALRMETEKLAARNQQARQDREVRQKLAPWQLSCRSF